MVVVQRNTNKAVDTAHRFLNNLTDITEESSVKVRIARLWDNFHINKKNELLSIDMVLIDEESNYIHATLPKRFADSFRKKSLQEGKIYVITKFKVLNNKKKYAVVESNSSMLQFHTGTEFNEEDYDDGKIPRHIFEFVSYDHLEDRIGKDLHTDIIGVIVDVNPIEQRRTQNGIVDMLTVRLKDMSGDAFNVTLWDRHATVFDEALKRSLRDAPNPYPNVAVITSTIVKLYQGDVCPGSSSATKIYINIDIPEAARLIQPFKGTGELQKAENAGLAGSAVLYKLDKTRTISEILSLAISGDNKDAVFNCVATITEIFDDHSWYYVSCPNCRKTAKSTETQFKCEHCNTDVEYPVTRYRLEVGVKDSTDSTMFVLFEEVAEQVTQLKLADLTSILENETVSSPTIPPQLQKIIGSTHIFQVKMKSYFESGGRKSFTVSRIVEPKVKVEKDDKVDNVCKPLSSPPKINTPCLPQKRKRLRLQYEEESDGMEEKEIGSNLGVNKDQKEVVDQEVVADLDD